MNDVWPHARAMSPDGLIHYVWASLGSEIWTTCERIGGTQWVSSGLKGMPRDVTVTCLFCYLDFKIQAE
jgi:hypothetical protein